MTRIDTAFKRSIWFHMGVMGMVRLLVLHSLLLSLVLLSAVA